MSAPLSPDGRTLVEALIRMEVKLSNMIEEAWPSASAWRGALIETRADVRALLAAPEPEGARGVPRQVTGDWMGTWRNWIAPFHFCPRCGESLNWRQCLDALDSPMITTECCGIHHSADGMIAKLAEKCSPAPAVRDAAPEGEGARCADCGLPYGGPAEVSP